MSDNIQPQEESATPIPAEKVKQKPNFTDSYASYHLEKYGRHKQRLTDNQKKKRKASKAQGKSRKLNRA